MALPRPCLLALLLYAVMMAVAVAQPRQHQQQASERHRKATRRPQRIPAVAYSSGTARGEEGMQGRLHAAGIATETQSSHQRREEVMQGRLHAAGVAAEKLSVQLRHERSLMHEGAGNEGAGNAAVEERRGTLTSLHGTESASSAAAAPASSAPASASQLRTMLSNAASTPSADGTPCVARKKMLWFTSIAGKYMGKGAE